MIQIADIRFLTPMFIIAAAAIITLMIGVFFKKSQATIIFICVVSLILSIYAYSKIFEEGVNIINNTLRFNITSNAFGILILLAIFITLLASKNYLENTGIYFIEFYSLLLFACLGMLLMVHGNDLIIIFLGLEMMSICFYILTGFMRKKIQSNESALKYFLLGSFLTGFLLIGISLIYGSTGGITNIINVFSNTQFFKSPVFIIGIALFLIGFMFKIGIFPFHMWIPDVYEGAPTIVSGMMSTAGKIAAVGTIAQIVFSSENLKDFYVLFAILAVITMLFGNVIALAQSNLKRLLAYSSISSAGYILVAFAAMNSSSTTAVLIYLFAYLFMQLGAFIVVSIIEVENFSKESSPKTDIENYKGYAKKNPFLAFSLTIFLFSLAGIPPLAGFWGKYYLFYSAIISNKMFLVIIAIIAILLSILSVFYYLRIIVNMWFKEPDEPGEIQKKDYSAYFAVFLSLAGTIVFGFIPQLIFTIFKIK